MPFYTPRSQDARDGNRAGVEREADASSQSATFLNTLQEIAWLLLVILIPLGINLWGARPFELPKVVVLQTLVWLLAGLMAIEALLRSRLRWRMDANGPVWASAGLLAVIIALTTWIAADPRLSLWGSYFRSQGAMTLLTTLLLFVLAAVWFREMARARQVIIALALTALPIILLSLAQAAGQATFGLVTDARSPIIATLGRAHFVGAYLAMLIPLTLALLLTARTRWLWAMLLAGELLVVGLTQARGAWLAAATALAVFLLLWRGGRLSPRGRWLGWLGVAALFLMGPLIVLAWGPNDGGSLAARLVIWKQTLALIAQRPFIGFGPDALGLVFPRVYPPELVYLQGRDFFVDRAHNLLLDWLVTTGVPGLLAFLLLLGTCIHTVGRGLRRTQSPQKRALLIAILAAVLGNVVNNLVSFDVTATAMTSWLLMGMGVALVTPATRPLHALGRKPGLWRWAAAGLMVVVIGVGVWQVNARQLMADIAARSAQQHIRTGAGAQAVRAAERAAALWPAEPNHQRLLSQIYWQRAVDDPAAASRWLSKAETALQTAQRLRPEDAGIWLDTARFYAASARTFGAPTLAPADRAFGRAASLAPNRAAIFSSWGRMWLEADDPSKAAPLLRKAVMLDASDGETYISLGAAELALGRREVALADYREAVRLLPRSGPAYRGLARALWQLGRRDEAARALRKALAFDPQGAQAVDLRQRIHNP